MTATSDDYRGGFATTRWSIITRFGGDAGEDPSRALAELCARYRYPVYAYLRALSHAPPVALEIADRFLAHIRTQPPARASGGRQFREFLLARLRAWPIADSRASADPADDRAAELERRYARDRIASLAPEDVFHRGFALEVVVRAFERLREEAHETGHGAMYDALGPFIARDPASDEGEALAAVLRTRPLAVVVALKRLRQRLYELASEELADTVASADELAREQRAMADLLRGG